MVGFLWCRAAFSQTVEFRQGFSGCVDVVVTSPISFDGLELAWQYQGLEAPVVSRGSGLPEGVFMAVNLTPPSGCQDGRPGVAVGIAVGVTPLPADEHVILEVCHSPPVPNVSLCGQLDFVDCLGSPPILNRLYPGPVDLAEVDGEVCFAQRPFRRGDLDGDGVQSVGDAVRILHCLFLQSGCPACFDAADANDDGFTDISDVVFLLSWRVGLVPSLPPPAVECGTDPTDDAELCPETGSPACAWAELRWDAPTTNEDGSPLDDLFGYRIYSGPASAQYDMALDVGLENRVQLALPPTRGHLYFAVTALDTSGNESGFSNEVSKEF